MGYFNDFFKALFVKLGQKYADNYGSATNTVVPLLNQSDMSPKGAMSVQDFALALGAFTYKNTVPEESDVINLETGFWVKGSSSTNLQNLPPGESTAAAAILSFRGSSQRIFVLYATSSHFYYYLQLGTTGAWTTIL